MKKKKKTFNRTKNYSRKYQFGIDPAIHTEHVFVFAVGECYLPMLFWFAINGNFNGHSSLRIKKRPANKIHSFFAIVLCSKCSQKSIRMAAYISNYSFYYCKLSVYTRMNV